MKKTIITIAALIIGMPATSIAASFDCSKAKGYTELTICTTPTLSTLDDKLSILYQKVNKKNPDNTQLIKKSQLSWLKDVRNKATTAQSLKDAYISRINDLNMMLDEDKPVQVEQPVQPQPKPKPEPEPQPQPEPEPEPQSQPQLQPEVVLDHRIDNIFNEKFMPDGEKDMNVRFDSFMRDLSSIAFQTDLKGHFSYTNKREAYLYKVNGNIMMILLANNKTNRVNYVSVIVSKDDDIDSIALLREIMRSMRINATYKLVEFAEKSEDNLIAHEIIEGNEYLTQKTQSGFFIMIRKS